MIGTFTDAHLRAAMFSNREEVGSRYSGELLDKLYEEAEEFYRKHITPLPALENKNIVELGYDLWFTRNRYGTGFWDNEELTAEERDKLTLATHKLGEVELYLGDDGKVYAL